MECLRPEPSEKLMEIGLSLLKFVSSHRGLTYVPAFCGGFMTIR
jgi:DNA-directed RNA polymerase